MIARTFTDDRGHYALPRLPAGVYQVQASTALTLPTIQPDLRLLTHSRVIVNLTLSTLYQAMQWLPAEQRRPDAGTDDWEWTLRLAANRPLLRMLDPGAAVAPVMLQGAGSRADRVKARELLVHSGLARFGQGGLQQQVAWSGGGDHTRGMLVTAQTAIDAGGLGRLSTTAAYRQELSPDRSMTTVVTLTERPAIRSGEGAGLETIHARSGSTMHLGDLADLSAGTEIEANRPAGGQIAAASHPYASIAAHAGGSTLAYRVATARTMTDAASLESEAATDAPALSMVDGRLRVEQGLHQELSLEHSSHTAVGDLTAQLGVFHDTLEHPVLEAGGDEAMVDSRDVLYDPGTGTIAVSGKGYSGGGVMAMLRDQLSPDNWLTLRYAMGDAVSLPDTPAQAAPAKSFAPESFGVQRSEMAAIAAGTRIAATGTSVRGSYRWQPLSTLTQVTPFDSSVPDAYLGLSIRQPLHLQFSGSGQLAAVVDVRNLLAQGYRPFLSQDGTTVYFAQSQRCLAAGLSFTF